MRAPYVVLLTVLVYIFISCSGSTTQNPLEPADNTSTNPVITIQNEPSAAYTNQVMWGFWKIRIDENNEAEVIYQRNAELHFNCVRLLEASPCSSCLIINNFHFLPNYEIKCDLTIRHPFIGNAKFTGFDVRGVFISMADYLMPESGRMMAWGPDLPRMLNYDGYTALFNPVEFPEGSTEFPALAYFQGKYSEYDGLDSTLNPFIAYKPEAPRRIFIAGEASTRQIHLYAVERPFEFGYVVNASWLPIEGPVNDPLNQFPPEANAIEAYQIDVDADLSEFTTLTGSQAPVTLTIFDHQGQETIEDVTLECPDLFVGSVTMTYAGSSGDGHEYTGTITNELGAGLGTYPVLVRVTDTATDANLGDVDAYQLYQLPISIQATWPPVALAGADPLTASTGQWIDFFDDGSYDPDGGNLTKFEWDFNNDGIYDWEAQNCQQFWNDPGTYYVQFQVTDDEGETDTLDQPIVIVIDDSLGDLTGVIKDGLNLQPINGATAETNDGGYQSDTTEIDGVYDLYSLPEGQVQVDFSCPGYIPVTAWFDIVAGETTIGDVVLMAPENPDNGSISGTCINAITTNGIMGVNLDIRDGMNNLTGPIIDSTVSNQWGDYSFSDLPPGTYTIYGEVNGYNPAWINAVVIGGQDNVHDIVFSPILATGELRIVLTWDQHPRDLDSHLFTPFIESSCYWHVAYYYMGSQSSAPYAFLDIDDVNSYGPETTTIKQLFPGRYKFFVHHYFLWSDDQGSLSSTSNAVVKVYDDNGLLATFNVPTSGNGLYWEVFDYDANTYELISINEIRDTRPLWDPRCNDSAYDNSDTYP